MFLKILVGVDGQSGGRSAIALAEALVADEGRVILAHVHPGGERFTQPPFDPDFEFGQHSESIALLERERNSMGCDAETITIGAHAVDAGLRHLAEDLHPDLLVVGSTSHRRLGRVLRDHARAALSDALCCVAIAPVDYASSTHPLDVVGVAYDASPESRSALDAARRLVHGRHASVRALRVLDTPSSRLAPSENEAHLGSIRRAAQRQLDELEGVDGEAVYGHVGPALAQWSESLDLIILGLRPRTPAGRLIYGSTSLHVSRHARCPVLVTTDRAGQNQSPSIGRSDLALSNGRP